MVDIDRLIGSFAKTTKGVIYRWKILREIYLFSMCV